MRCVVFGGTGTLGSELLRQISPNPDNQITVISRGELAQQQLKREYPNVRFVIGDVKDRSSFVAELRNAETVFHFAALKHVDVVEENPLEGIKTNLLGTINVAEESINAGVRHFVFCSTDKAVLPINAYGMSKALAEKYLDNRSKNQTSMRVKIYRWGNVVGSRGSVVKIFTDSLKAERAIYLTDERMSRFWIRIEDAVHFMLDTYRNYDGLLLIPPIKASTVRAMGEAIAALMGIDDAEFRKMPVRAGEKLYEVLESTHAKCLRSDTCAQYTHDELMNLIDPIGGSSI